ncbi:MAG: sugar phosphate isomerase/epimerase [Clostridia bacterium]|nr:sugar phosphate isomerase/epimerase [Clostridia bacterium]
MKLPIALQLYSVRDALAEDFYGTLKKVKEMGYDGVELSGLGHKDPKEVRAMIDELGLKMNSSHVPVEEMQKEGGLARYKQAGCDYVVVPWIHYGGHNQHFEKNLDIIRDLAYKAHDEGLTLLYHNHDFEFKCVEGKTILDSLYDYVPAEYLKTQLDTCWVKFAGSDPVEYLKKYAGRAPLVHLKDFWEPENVGGEKAVPYDLIGKTREDRENDGFEFRPLGHGIQDIPAILAASKAAGAEWVIVEQDESVGRTPLEAVKMSIDYLHSFEW